MLATSRKAAAFLHARRGSVRWRLRQGCSGLDRILANARVFVNPGRVRFEAASRRNYRVLSTIGFIPSAMLCSKLILVL